MKLLKPTLLLMTMLLFTAVRSQDFLRASGKKIVNAKGEDILLRGIGLGGWMIQEGYMLHVNNDGQQHKIRQRIESLVGKEKTASFYTAWLRNQTTKSDIDSLHAWGFNSVRLPMHYNLYTLPVEEEPVLGENTWLPLGFELTDSLIAWCKANQMRVILDLHAAPGGQGNDLNISDGDASRPSLWQSEANKKKTIALWQQLALRYANEPAVAGYDILNEPNWGFEDSVHDRNGLREGKNIPLKQLMKDITVSIRTVDKNHLIIIEGNGWGNNYQGILPLWDDNMVLSFHKYWNDNDKKSIQHMLDIRDQYQVPIWLGETGENSNTWFTDAIRLFEKNNIGWSWWPLKKLGNNNPLQTLSNPGYDSLVNYWNGKTTKVPENKNAYEALMKLAKDSKNENNIVHRDVIDAMIRQPFSDATVPFHSFILSPRPAYSSALYDLVVDAVDYDLGVNGKAYYDLDTANYRISAGKESIGNRGKVYRNDGVDIYEDSFRRGKYVVGSMENGEWLQYTIDVLKAGRYDLQLGIYPAAHETMVAVTEGSDTLAAAIKIQAAGLNKKLQYVKVGRVSFSAGIHKLRLYTVKGGFQFSEIVFMSGEPG